MSNKLKKGSNSDWELKFVLEVLSFYWFNFISPCKCF